MFEEIDNKRKKCAVKVGIGLPFIGIGIILGIVLSVYDDQGPVFPIILIACFAIGIIFLSIGGREFKKVQKEFKDKYLKDLFEATYENCKYSPEDGFSINESLASRIIPKGDRYVSSDLITGSFDDVLFRTCDVHVEEMHTTTDSNGHTTTEYQTIFLGRIFRFGFNKNISSDVVLSESRSIINLKDLHRVKLESVEFNKKFKTYALEDLNAYYLLTPRMMLKMLEIEKKYKGKCSFSFVGNSVYFSIYNNVDTFEIPLFQKVSKDILNTFQNDIDVMKDLIAELKLNNKIYSTEE